MSAVIIALWSDATLGFLAAALCRMATDRESVRRVLAMTEQEEAIALIAAGIRKLGELSKAIATISTAAATISTAARLIAEDLDAVERALILVGSYLREGRPEESDPTMLLRLCQGHIRSLIACIDRLNELNATAELRVVAQELTRLGFRASPDEPTGNPPPASRPR